MCPQFNPWKKSLIFIVLLFVLPNALTGQNSQFSSEVTIKKVVKSSSSQPGDFLMAPLTGNVKFLFISVEYPGVSEIVSTAELRDDADLVEKNIEGNSYDKVSLTIDVTPTLMMPNPVSYYTSDPKSTLVRIATDAVKISEQAGFDVDSYGREVIFSKQIWGGSAALGTINRRTAFMSHSVEYTMVHELGHTFGWRHTNFWEVKSGSPISSEGTEEEYGDRYDMMGSRGAKPPYPAGIWHHFNPWLKYRNGWIPDESILNVTDSGTYTIQTLNNDPMTGTSVTKYTALKIRRDALVDYWVFFRGSEEFIDNGPVITRIFNTNVKPTHLLDMTPGSQSADWKDAALPVGKTFSDTQNGITVKTISRSPSEVQVEVTVDPNAIAAVDNLPVIDIVRPALGQRTLQGVVDYEVTAFDPDVGDFNGAGIAKVKLFIHIGNDPLISNLRQGLDPPKPQATMEFSAPPYLWQVDTNTSSPYLPDCRYQLIVKATSVQGGVRFIQFEHLIDNSALPAKPVLSAPSENATNVSTDTTLVWSFSSGATSYQVQVSTESDFSTIILVKDGITSNIYAISGLANNATYYWRVNATNANGTSPYSTAWKFTTIVAAPAAPALSEPSDNAIDIATDTTLVWASSNGATLYQLQVSTVSDFSTIELDQSGLMTPSYRVTGLSNSTAYFWRVKASNVGGESPWSMVWQFTTIVAGPAAPLLSSPADNAIDIPTTPILVWNTSGGAASYDLQVSTQSNFATLELDESSLSDTTFQATGLSNSTTQYWRVRAANTGGTSPWSAVWKFTTITAGPALPVLSVPLDTDTGVPINPTLVWNEAERATTYQLQLSISSNFSPPIVDQSGIADTSFQVPVLLNNTIYFWRVRAANAGGTSDWSSVRHFTTIVAALAAPVLSSPADNAENLSVELNLVWNAVSGAVSYQIQVSTQSDFSTGLMGQSGLPHTSFRVRGLANETTYFWRVKATNIGGTGPWSTVWQFTTEPVSSVETGKEIPSDFRLGQNYPNPFNPTTNISFDLPKAEYVILKVYSLLGKEIATLVSGNFPAGRHIATFDASGQASGVYLYKLQSSSFVQTKKMLLVR